MEHFIDVVGVTAFKGTIDGRSYDSGKLFFVQKLDCRQNIQNQDSLNWKIGNTIDMYRLPSSDLAMRIVRMNPSFQKPLRVAVVIERYSNGRESQDVIVDVVPQAVNESTGEIRALPAKTGKEKVG